MRMIIGDQSEWVCRWVAEQLGEPGAFQNKAYGIAIIHRDVPVAGVVYHDWTDNNLFISIASTSPYWCSRLTLRAIFGYAFNQMRVKRVSVIVKGGNKKWRQTLKNRFGFVPEGKLKHWFGTGHNDDGYLLRMTRDECKWIKGNEGFKQQQRAAV